MPLPYAFALTVLALGAPVALLFLAGAAKVSRRAEDAAEDELNNLSDWSPTRRAAFNDYVEHGVPPTLAGRRPENMPLHGSRK